MSIVLQETLRGLLYAALALDAYREQGVDVRFVSARRPSEAARGLLGGTMDVTWGGPMRVMETYDKQPDCGLVCFCEVVTRDPFCLVVRGTRPNLRLADLMGTTIATVGEVHTPWLCLQEDLRRAGLDPGAIDRISDRSMMENLQALRDGKIAAAFRAFHRRGAGRWHLCHLVCGSRARPHLLYDLLRAPSAAR